MNVTKRFLRDFAYLANRCGWTPAEIEEIKTDTRANPALVHYWTVLADAYRAGYEQTSENGYIRLQAWCIQNGRPDPFMAVEIEGRPTFQKSKHDNI